METRREFLQLAASIAVWPEGIAQSCWGPSVQRSRTILCSNDEPTCLKALRILLTEFGYEDLLFAATTARTIQLAELGKPALVITDMHKGPNTKSGVQIARAIRGNLGLSHTPILLASAFCMPICFYDGLFDGELWVPYRVDELQEAVQRYVVPRSAGGAML